MISYTVKISDDFDVNQYYSLYVEKNWHVNSAAIHLTNPQSSENVKFSVDGVERSVNYNYVIVPFIKTFVSMITLSERTDYNSHNDGYWMNLPKLSYVNGYAYAPTSIVPASSYPSDLGKDLINIPEGVWSDNLWYSYPSGNWPYEFTYEASGYECVMQHALNSSFKPLSKDTIVSVNFNDLAGPEFKSGVTYKFAKLFQPIIFSSLFTSDNSVYPAGLILMLGVKAVEVAV